MNLIHHVLDIQAPPETVFTSITTADGLSPWWTTKVQADNAELGSLFLLTFRGPFNPQLRISEIESPSRVTWEGVSGTGICWGSAGTIKRAVEGELLATVPRNWRRRCELKLCPRERASGSGSLRFSAGPAEDIQLADVWRVSNTLRVAHGQSCRPELINEIPGQGIQMTFSAPSS